MKQIKFLLSSLAFGAGTMFLFAGCSVSIGENTLSRSIVPCERMVEKQQAVGDFQAVSVSQGIQVNYRQTDGRGKAVIHVPENLEEYLVVKTQKDGTLRIAFDFPKNRGGVKGDCRTSVDVEGGALTRIEASSAAHFAAAGDLRLSSNLLLSGSSSGTIKLGHVGGGALKADLSSAAKCRIENVSASALTLSVSSAAQVAIGSADCTALDGTASSAASIDVSAVNCEGKGSLSASSAGKVNLSGKVQESLSISASSGAKVQAETLVTSAITADATSGASVTCHPSDELIATFSSGGRIGYVGNPRRLKTDKSGVYQIK